ncbi:Major facilitator superfamily domain general substrate transporter [Penicillium paradoxum]|uniref:Major facilitator superfamily domain general substrate transporter n=1 Tax=Penicillium paradoxum TaxID=176176 RepID=UPI00254672C1|nr:Major facilitator superfamily domain general substrate transporter [Penicillium paradoxum]KAJ5773340.1 Major facilitator superfamily domain general substrate transporter [Penicillium paradoxum]
MGSISDNVYLLGRDEAETTRLNNQHRFLVELSSLIHPSITKDLTAVADLGTGTGVWLEDVAELLPNKSAYLHGFDISSDQYPPGHEIPRLGQKPIQLSVHNALHSFPPEHHGRYDLVHIRLLTAGLKQADYTTVLVNARALLKPNGWIQWEEVDHTAFCTDAVPEPAAINDLRQSVIEAMLRLGLWPFAPQRVYEEISAGGFADVVRETYTTVGKDHMRVTAQKWVAGVMRALVPASMVATGEAENEQQAREIVDGLVGEFEAHSMAASTEMDIEEVQQPTGRSKLQVTAIMVALSLSMFIAALDQTIMATAIPTIAAYFHSSSGYTWIGGAYLLSSAASACIWAKLSDIWGRKPILLLAVGWFFLSSIVCAAATSMEMLIAGRALQGVAGGGLLQLVTIIISDLFSVRHRSLYLGLMEVMWAFAGGVGPLLGGAFSQYVTWRWTYWINLPISGVTFVLLFFFLDVHNPQTKIMDGVKAIDWFGSISVLGLTLMLLLGLDFGGETFAWKSPQVICLIVFGALCSLLFVYSEKKLAKYPLMPMDIFARFSNIATLLVAFAHGFVFIAGEYYIPLYLQSVHGSSPMGSGVLILPLVVMEAFSGMFTGAIIHRTGRYLELIWIGLILMTIGNGLYIDLGVGSSVGKIVGYQILTGLGAGFLFQTPIIAIQAMVSQEDTATATATIGFIRNMATASSIVIGGVVFQNSMGQKQSSLLASGMSASMAAQMSGDSAAASIESIKFITDPAQLLAVREAFAWSLRNMWILYTCMSAVGVFFSAFIPKTKLNTEHVETKTGLNVEKTPVVTAVHST